MPITNTQTYVFDTNKQIQTIEKAYILAAIKFFALKQCGNNTKGVNKIITLLIKNLVRFYNKFSKKVKRNLNLLS